MKRIISAIMCIFVLAAMFTVMASAAENEAPVIEVGSQVAKAIYGTPEIDGYAESIWDEAQINTLNYVYTDDGITTPTVVRFRTMWDEKYLYFLVEVQDATMGDLAWEELSLGGNLWRRDGISFTFSPDYNRDVTAGQVEPAFWFIIGAYGNTANWNNVPQNVFISEDEGVTKMYAISYYTDYNTNTNYGYTIECKINLAPRYEGIKMEAGTKVGFDMYSNDNNYFLMSTGREHGRSWGYCEYNCGTVNSYKNDAEKGTIEFCDKTVKFENKVEDLEWIKAPETTVEDTTTAAPDTTTAAPDTTTAEPVDTTTAVPEDTTTEAPAETTTAAPVETTTAAPTTEAPKTEGGCGGFVAASVIVIAVAALGGAVILNKKEN